MTEAGCTRVLLLLCLATALTACGSTVQQTGASLYGEPVGTGDGLSVATPAGNGTQPSASGEPTVGAVAPRGGTPTTGGAGSGSAASAPATVPAAGSVRAGSITGVGFDQKRVLIGVGTSDDASAFAASAGLPVSVGDPKAQAQALIDDLNKHGGLAGRQIVPVWHNVSAADYNANPSNAAQAQCADWTEDHKVFAAVNILTYPENGVACLAKARTIGLTSAPGLPVSGAMLRKYSPYFYGPGLADTEHLVPALVDDLVRQRYFTPWDTRQGKAGAAPVKIGVIYAVDRPDLLRLYQAALARQGLKVSDSFFAQGSQDAGQLAGVALKFKADGVTHVFTNGFLSFFPTVAETQGYRPRYGVSSWDTLQTAVQSGSPAQFAGAAGIGWTPALDVDQARDPGLSAAGRRCLALMKADGQDTSQRTVQGVMESMCEQFELLRAALERAVGLSPLVMRDGVESLARRMSSALTFGERFAPGRHAGVAAFRPIRFDSACTCLKYPEPVRTFD